MYGPPAHSESIECYYWRNKYECKGVLMKSFTTIFLFICICCAAASQGQNTQIHPQPPDLATALQSVSVVLNRIDSPLSALAIRFDSEQVSTTMHTRRLQIRELATSWASIITVSNGKELPSASDLFTIYTEMLNIQSYSSDLTREGRFNSDTANLARDATLVIRGQTELLPIVETLQYAVSDRIDAEEAACQKRSKAKKH